MRDSKLRFLIFFGLILFVQNLSGQMYQYKQYSVDEGLSHPFVYSICEDKNGFIWVGTGEGLCCFDGFEFKLNEEDASLTSGFVTSSFLDENGILWFGHNSGQVTYYNGYEMKLLKIEAEINSSITDIKAGSKGDLFIATQNNGLLRVNKGYKVDTFKTVFNGKILYSIANVNDNLFLVGSSSGLELYKFEDGQFKFIYTIKELENITTQSVTRSNSNKESFWIGTEDSGFFLLTKKDAAFDSYELINMGDRYGLTYENVQAILEEENGVLWLSTFGKGILKLIPDENKAFEYKNKVHYSTANGLPNNFIKTIYRDREGNHWIGTYGNGLAFSVDEAFTVNYQSISELHGDILSLAESDSLLWLGGENAIARVNTRNNKYDIFNSLNGLPKDKITSLYFDDRNILWIGTNQSGIFQLNAKTGKIKQYYRSENSIGNSINCITGFKNKVWVGSKNGVLIFDLESGKRIQYNTSDGLPHNDIKHLFIDSKEHEWAATKSNGVVALDTNFEYTIEGNVSLEFVSITEDVDGNIWAATYGDGVFKFEHDSIKYYYSENGLKSNYCYSIIADKSGYVWVGHRLGLSRINVKTGGVQVYGKETGIDGDCNQNAVLINKDGKVLIGTTEGLVVYDASKERKKKFAPKLNIKKVTFSGQPVDLKNPIHLPFDIYKLNIEYVGLNYSNPDGVKYQYKLEGYDLDWSDFTKSREVYYPRIEDGSYTFILKACNVDGECVDQPLEISMVISPPFWKTWWFITLSVVIVISLIYTYIKRREKKQKALQEYLERELQERTREVVLQKEQLEIKNRDITDSINYAQRIQQSILPSITTINENFSESFVYYQARDIVSGDFYWYDRVNNNKFLIVCADSTGHGVPGAFMSMIGTTLIKDICLRKDIESPSEVLQSLDKELQGTLNQNLEAERAHDGMDIIVCEIDVNTNYMRFASAMRPMILYKDKKLQYVRGTKASIGGDPKAEKRFENIGFQLHKGDIIYMFSDGYPDQFGGPRGKKFKMDRVKNMLADVCDKPMDEQQVYVDKTFNEWRGKLQQVDDVLFMGVRI